MVATEIGPRVNMIAATQNLLVKEWECLAPLDLLQIGLG